MSDIRLWTWKVYWTFEFMVGMAYENPQKFVSEVSYWLHSNCNNQGLGIMTSRD